MKSKRERWLILIFVSLSLISGFFYWETYYDKKPEFKPAIEQKNPHKRAVTPQLLEEFKAKYHTKQELLDAVKAYELAFSPSPTPLQTPPPSTSAQNVLPKVKAAPLHSDVVIRPLETRKPKKIFADISVEGIGVITLQLMPERAPKTVNNFIRHCEDGTIEVNNKPLYSGMQIFRTVRDYFIQTGDPLNNGTGNSGSFDIEEFNTASIDITTGMVVMAKLGKKNSTSQFYIALRDMDKVVEGRNTVFGVVVGGLSLVQNISRAKADFLDKPLKPIIVKDIKIRRTY